MDVRVGLQRRLSAKELMLLNCGVGEDSCESLGLKAIQTVHSKGDQPWVFQRVHPEGNQSSIIIGRTDAEIEAPILWPHDATN